MLETGPIEELLQRFRQNPKEVMNSHPEKTDAQGQGIPGHGVFGRDAVQSKAYIKEKDRLRLGMRVNYEGAVITLDDIGPGKAAIAPNDLPENLVDNGNALVTTLEEMESRNLTSKKLRTSPWSDSYWPIYQGILGARYADGNFPSTNNKNATFGDNYNYVRGKPAGEILGGGSSSAIDRLSPAEKYDLLIGDGRLPLTNAMWYQGKKYWDAYGKVEPWMGICHGWAPASYCELRPRRRVSVQTVIDGRPYTIRFYPSDIKGLASLLWAEAAPPANFIGGRCNDQNPKADAVGRVISGDCFDTNPGAWHLSVINQIGISDRSFVMDATFDYEVWNQPIFKYRYFYFNPMTGKGTEILSEAKVEVADFTGDQFRKYRGAAAAYLVGVVMDVTYVAETEPNHNETDDADNDYLKTVRYLYDLELDGAGNITGGEWYNNAHPDFLWTPRLQEDAETSADPDLADEWDGSGPLPDEWRSAAQDVAQKGEPLGKIVDALIRSAQ